MNDARNVVAGKPKATGGVLYGPRGTTIGDDPSAALPSGLYIGGYVSEDGLTKSETREFTAIKDWGGLTIKRTQSNFEVTFGFAFLEYLSPAGAEAVYGPDAVEVTPATSTRGQLMKISVTGQESPRLLWVFDMADGDGIIRIVVPDAQVTETGETTFSVSGGATRPVTLSAYPVDGVFYYELTDNGAKAVTVADVMANYDGPTVGDADTSGE